MKRIKILCLALTASCFAVSSQAQDLSYRINGKLQHISPMPAKMYLSEVIATGILSNPVDSTVVNADGTYQFKGSLTADEPFGVRIAPSVKGSGLTNEIQVIIDKGELNIVSDNTINHITVTGSAALAQHQFEEMRASTKATTDSIAAMSASEEYKTDKKLQAEVTKKSLGVLGRAIFDMYTYAKTYPENRVSPYTTYFLLKLPFLKQPGKDTLLKQLPARVWKDKLGEAIINADKRNKFLADSIDAVIAARTADNISKIPLGTKAPAFTQNDVHGKPVSLASFKGKYVLIDFWASWCAPCRAENPNVVNAYKQYKDKGFTVLGVSLDSPSGKDAWIKAIEKDGLTWTQVSDLNGWKNTVAELYQVKSIPQNFLVDPNGVIVGKNLRGGDLDKKLASIFK